MNLQEIFINCIWMLGVVIIITIIFAIIWAIGSRVLKNKGDK